MHYKIKQDKVFINKHNGKIDIGSLTSICLFYSQFEINEEIYNKLDEELKECFEEIN